MLMFALRASKNSCTNVFYIYFFIKRYDNYGRIPTNVNKYFPVDSKLISRIKSTFSKLCVVYMCSVSWNGIINVTSIIEWWNEMLKKILKGERKKKTMMKLHHCNSKQINSLLRNHFAVSTEDAISVMNGSSCIEACLCNSTELILVLNPCFLYGRKKKRERIRAPYRFYQ